MPCPNECGYMGNYLEGHYRHSPHCRPAPPRPQENKRTRSQVSSDHFQNKIHSLISKEMLRAKVDLSVDIPALDAFREVIIGCAMITIDFIQDECSIPADVVSAARKPYASLPAAATLVQQRRRTYKRADVITLSEGHDKKGAAFLSVRQLVAIILQESEYVRKQIKSSSDLWKTGALYGKKPAVSSDVIHGRRFYDWFDVCGPASPSQNDDLRVVLHCWQDGMTPIDGLSQKARKHKYGVVLASFVNLPLQTRFYEDFILLLALYNERYSNEHGGLSRMLTGVGRDGKDHRDPCCLAAEIEPFDASPLVEMPNDDDPNGPPLKRRLRLFILLFSLDWLAHGDFGPYAGSVSAKFPCFKCHWTESCPCFYMSANDARRSTMKHIKQCRGIEPRTHEGVMDAVRELRALNKERPSQAKQFSTDTGIFSANFASERLLRDVVKDAAVDMMHWGPAGMTRYLWSWVTDDLIPQVTTWDAVNAKKNAYKFPRGVRIPQLERSKGDKRGSTSTHLNSFEMLHFALARFEHLTPLARSCRACWHVSSLPDAYTLTLLAAHRS
mmetsp:Transcript_31047/g.81215  ORF Transcript_31047/g.81215 Transcript_31047/m.81215 type:complete len:556 (-) Transcript_31047:839-2506(-)